MAIPTKWFRTACDLSPCPIGYTDAQQHIKYVNPAFAKLLGYSTEELQHKTWMSITHSDDIGAGIISRQALGGENDYCYTRWKRYIHKNGNEIPVIVTVWRYPASEAPLEGYTLIATSDVKEYTLEELRKKHEEKLIELEKRVDRIEEFRKSTRVLAEFSVKYIIPFFGAIGGFVAWLLSRDK